MSEPRFNIAYRRTIKPAQFESVTFEFSYPFLVDFIDPDDAWLLVIKRVESNIRLFKEARGCDVFVWEIDKLEAIKVQKEARGQ